MHGRHKVGPFSAFSSSSSAKCRPNPFCSAPASRSRLATPPKRTYASMTHSAPPATRPPTITAPAVPYRAKPPARTAPAVAATSNGTHR